jgi:Zn-dependent peptidase ImmA (M78 family)
MSLVWDRLAGSTDRFAVRISLITDPHGGKSADADTSLSWGALQLWVEGQNLCAHVDQAETLSSVHWYLLPFLEWLADSWDPLLHEERLPVRNSGDDAASALFETKFAPILADNVASLQWEEEWFEWHERHALRAARDGGLFPNVFLRRFRDRIEVSWDDEPLPGALDDFVFSASRGVARLEPREVAEPLYDVVRAVISQLLEWRPESSRFRQLMGRFEVVQSAARRERRVAWLAGLRGWRSSSTDGQQVPRDGAEQEAPGGEIEGVWHKVVQSLRSFGNEPAAQAALATESSPLVVTGSCQAALLFGAVAPTVTEADVLALAEILIQQYRDNGNQVERLVAYEADPAPLGIPAYQQGYDLAEQLHDRLDFHDEWVDIERLLERLGVEVLHRPLSDGKIRGVSIVSPQHLPTIMVNSGSIYGTASGPLRFTLSHELCHLLFDREVGQRLAIASGAWAPRNIERRANAFAAMFLMPPRLLSSAIANAPAPINTMDGIEAIAQRLHVGATAAIQHLYNLTLMDESDRDALLSQLGGSPSDLVG